MSLFYSKKCYNVYLILEFVKKRLNLNLNKFLRQRIRLIHLDVFLKKVVLDIFAGKDILINNDFSNLIYCHFTVSCLIEFQHVCLTEQKNE